MADATLAQIDGARTIWAGVGRESASPRDVVRIDVDDARLRIDRWSAPFGTAIEAWKDHGIDSDRKRHKLTFAPEFPELFERPSMCFRSTVSQKLFRKKLACK